MDRRLIDGRAVSRRSDHRDSLSIVKGMSPQSPLWKKLLLLTDQKASATDAFLRALPAEEFPVHCSACKYQLRNLTKQRCPECGRPFDELELRRDQYADGERRIAKLLREYFSRDIDVVTKLVWYGCLATITALAIVLGYGLIIDHYVNNVLDNWLANARSGNVAPLPEWWLELRFGYLNVVILSMVPSALVCGWFYRVFRRHWIEKQLSTFDAAPSSHKPQASSPP